MSDHKNYIRYRFLESVHSDLIKYVKFIRENYSIISASEDSQNSIVISDPSKTKHSYSFSHSKVCYLFFIF